jgi:hypothetical protein
MKTKNTRPRDTSANRARKDKNPAFQRFGKSNGSFTTGKSAHRYRLMAGAKPHEVVHHKDHNKSNVTKANLVRLKNTKGSTAMAKHNQKHPEKGLKAVRARMSKIRKGK